MRSLLLLLLLSGCAAQPRVEIRSTPVLIHPELPEPVQLEAPKFYVLTKDNVDAFFEKEGELVIFAVNTDGYETLSVNVQELRRYIIELQGVVIYYKNSIEEYNRANDAR